MLDSGLSAYEKECEICGMVTTDHDYCYECGRHYCSGCGTVGYVICYDCERRKEMEERY